MSLVRQLTIATVTVLLLILLGSVYLMSNSAKNMLINQLESHSLDAATHLGLYMAQDIQAKDIAGIETTVNAIFDTGYYQRIEIADRAGEILFSKATPARVSENVPEWFQSYYAITPPLMNRDVTFGWTKVGSVNVQSRAGYAYDKLWQGVKDTIIFFGILCLVSAFAMGGLLAYILKPLRGVEKQAIALSEKQFIEQTDIPGTRELKRLVQAMNQMVGQVRLMFDEQTRHIQDLRRIAYQDNLTGLPNQRAAETQLTERLDFRKDYGRGVMFYLRISNLADLNNQLGMERASNFVRVVASRLQHLGEAFEGSVVGRLTGADFALLIPRPDQDALSRILNQLCADINASYTTLSASETIEQSWPVHIGVVFSDDSSTCSNLLADARLALQQAVETDQNYSFYQSDSQELSSSNQWHQHVANAISSADLYLLGQSLVGEGMTATGQNTPHTELFARIYDSNGQTCPAGEFISVVKALGLMEKLDRAVISLALAHIKRAPSQSTLAVNISTDSLCSPEFLVWFKDTVTQSGSGKRLHIEVNESSILNNLDQACEFRTQVKEVDVSFGVDNFGIHPSGFSYLYNLQPDYIKIDGSLIREIDSQAEDRFYISSLIAIAHSLSVKAYAEHVERDTQLMELSKLQIDGTQGWLHGQPERLTAD